MVSRAICKIFEENISGGTRDNYEEQGPGSDPEGYLKKVFEWNGTSWQTLEDELCTTKVDHTTVVYGGVIYHMGGQYAQTIFNVTNHYNSYGYFTKVYNR